MNPRKLIPRRLFLSGTFRKRCTVLEYGDAAVRFKRAPVPDDFSVQGDDRIEDTAPVMCVGSMARVKDHVSALVADEIFVIGGNQENASAPEAPGPRIPVSVIIDLLIPQGDDFVS